MVVSFDLVPLFLEVPLLLSGSLLLYDSSVTMIPLLLYGMSATDGKWRTPL